MATVQGVYSALVLDNHDPDNQGRVKVRLPGLVDQGGNEFWARLALTSVLPTRATVFVPDVGDEVLVVFERGDVRAPYIIGALWNGKDQPPASSSDTGKDNKDRKILASPQMSTKHVNNTKDVTLETPGGQRITLSDASGTVRLEDTNGNSVTLSASGVRINATARVTITASAVQIDAASVTVDAGMSRFSGVVQCDTLVTNSVVSSNYTPGVGNRI
jgi:uncharacterized protein involved in type VI secretion and phage assembly